MTFELQGHRGCRGLRPENTLSGFAAAIDLGVASIETDLQRTRDGILVLFHDFAVNPAICRPIDALAPDPASRPLFRDLTLDQLRGYAADGNPDPRRFPAQSAEADSRFGPQPWRIPTLAEFLALHDLARNLIFDLEIKRRPFRGDYDGIEEQVVTAVRAAGLAGRTRVRSFDHRVVRRVVELGLEGGLLVAGTAPGDPVALTRWAGARVYCPDFEFLDRDQVRQCQDEGIRVIPWTVNEPADLEKLLAWGVDGITTDYPDRLAKLLQERGLDH